MAMNTTVIPHINNCPNLPFNNTFIHTTINSKLLTFSYTLWAQSLSYLQSCSRDNGGYSYLRPDMGGALMPYVFTGAQIVLHLPTCLVRIARWERVQWLSIALATINLIITIQAYTSTQLKPNEVLVWTPITLILDAGSMLQIYIVIIEKIHFARFTRTLSAAITEPFMFVWSKLQVRAKGGIGEKHREEVALQTNSDTQYNLLNTVESPVNSEGTTAHVPETVATNEYLRPLDIPTPSTNHSTSSRPSRRSSTSVARVAVLESLSSHEMDKAVKNETLAATLALLVLLATLVLQIIGLAHARTGLAVKGLKAVWCSPFFQPQALVILSGCDVLPVVTSSSQGIACVELDADQQRTWLFMTTFILSLSLVFQLVDSCLLALNDGEQRGCHNAVRLRRPWLTTFGGMIILIILLMKGVEYADRLPNGISEGVIVFRYDPSLESHSVCKAHLKTPGLRGAIIGYSDGLFSSWGETYFGKNATMNHANR